jgi:hypothetical protein
MTTWSITIAPLPGRLAAQAHQPRYKLSAPRHGYEEASHDLWPNVGTRLALRSVPMELPVRSQPSLYSNHSIGGPSLAEPILEYDQPLANAQLGQL